MTQEERALLARIHRWARQRQDGTPWPRWERGPVAGWWRQVALTWSGQRAEVMWGPVSHGRLTVWVLDGRYGEKLRDESVKPHNIREAVNLLVVWGILPAEFLELSNQ